jgi:hypothetical protein
MSGVFRKGTEANPTRAVVLPQVRNHVWFIRDQLERVDGRCDPFEDEAHARHSLG